MNDTQPMAPTDAEIFVVAREVGLLPDNSHPAPETRAARKHSNAVQAFARAIEAEVRKQYDALILQLVEALENSDAALWEHDDDPSRPVHAAIAAGRAQLKGKP